MIISSTPRQGLFERCSGVLTEWSGSSAAFLASLGIVAGWAVTGPLFHYSDAWQLVINSITNIGTFVMVFLIQHAQNRKSLAVQLKFDELRHVQHESGMTELRVARSRISYAAV
jgi:low affinity Fe/Cu permease